MGALDRVFRGRRPSQERPLAAIIAGLWKNGDPGVWYDAGDMSTMFQDAAGTLPVYMPGGGQVDPPVGLWLDKRLRLVRGPEVLTNGGFESPDGWTLGENFSVSGGSLRKAAGAGTLYVNTTQACLVVGRWYELTLTISAVTSDQAGVSGTSFGGVPAASRLRTTAGVVKFIGQATNALLYLTARQDAAAVIDSISVRELPGNHAFQATTTSRPTLSARYNLLTGSEQLSGAGWSVVAAGSVSLTRTSGYPSPAGEPNAARLDFSSTATGEYCILRQIATVVSGAYMRPSIWLRADTPTTVYVRRGDQSGYDAFLVASDWAQFFPTSGAATSSTHNFDIGLKNSSSGASGAATIYAWGADLRAANDGVGLPSYQRAVDANTYDTVGFPLYLRFDGVDDWLQTANIDFSGTGKVDIFTAVRKLTDASRGVIIELGPNGYGQPDSFNQEQAWFSPNFAGSYSGSVGSATLTKPGVGAPLSAVLSTLYDKPGSLARLRYNGQLAASNNTSVGSGVFLKAPIFIGRRGGLTSAAAMRIYAAIVRGASTPDSTVPKVERYLNQQARIY